MLKMKAGNKPLMPVADALAAVLDGAVPLPEEIVTLEEAFHRTLSRDIASLRTQPPAAMSAMDGYAVRLADAKADARLKVIGESAAGKPFQQPVGPGEAVRIFTGGVVPPGAETIVIQEDVTRDGDTVIPAETTLAPRHIRRAGSDFREGDVLLRKGLRLTDRDLSLAASMNHPRLPVHRRPRVAILATGDELVMPGSTPGPGQIVFSNAYALGALARAEGAEVIDLGIARDTIEDTARAVRQARDVDADILVSTGGASVGDHDVVKDALESEGVAMSFWKIALRPGKPMMHGRLGPMKVIGLPGNPVSSYVCGFIFMVPLIRAMSGCTVVHHLLEAAALGVALPENDHRQEYLRAHCSLRDDGMPVAIPVGHQDSSLLGNLSVADVLIVRPPHAPAMQPGERCTIIKLPS